ncbi:hypothetical protein LO763_22325 [Glycomyces sp. A-F 0318]|uniref:hypothetical protein n=1 Tax=Glycomyces amatae TaxID=2881355 RepID=UPI001E2BB17D|nr:hypothetical protein [Glycomyces amatae]MCD0446355.1 hypothetical protein [Glycomyces amatae]
MSSERVYQADRIIQDRTGTSVLAFLDRLEPVSGQAARVLTQSIMDTYKFTVRTEYELLEAAAGDPNQLIAIEAHLRREPAKSFPALFKGAYDVAPSKTGVLRAAHETALAGLVNLLDAALALMTDHE